MLPEWPVLFVIAVSIGLAATLAIVTWARLPVAGVASISLGSAVLYAGVGALVGRHGHGRLLAFSLAAVVLAVTATVVLVVGSATPASGHPGGSGASRTWVSGVGDDVNPCSRTAPCKTFAGAISKTAAGGEINVLDPGGFGAVTITKSITISGEGAEAGLFAAGTNGIVVNAGVNDVVVLRGLDIEGFGTGLNGVRFLAGAALHVENSTINNFTQKGIDFEPSTASSLFVEDTVIRHNDVSPNGGGIFVQPTNASNVNATLDNVRLVQNLFGVKAGAHTKLTMSDSVAAGNGQDGAVAASTGAAAVLNVDGSTLANNHLSGARASGAGAKVRVSDNMVTDNAQGLSTVSGGSVVSFGNNSVVGNNTDGNPTQTINQR